MMADCYCRTCAREFKSLGIARHRAMHRDRKEVCAIVFNKIGEVKTWDYRDKKMTNEELKAAIKVIESDVPNLSDYEIVGVYFSDCDKYADRCRIVVEAARELSQLKEGTHPDMAMVPKMKDGRAGMTPEMFDAFWAAYIKADEHRGNFESVNAGYNAMIAEAQKGNVK